ncbi:MAG: hypothetical protein IJM97_00995 [Clostridia bacterium]|nr:hypothetical protein [Clostridia bacterium]
MAEKRSISSLIIGFIVMLFAVIGVVVSIVFIVGKISDAADNSEKKAEYEAFLAPVVMNDPTPFDDITLADTSQLIEASIWSLMGDNLSPDKYTYSDGGILIPQSDVEKAFEKLFGNEVTPEHKTVNEYFVYDETQKGYLIPVTGVLPIYTPKVCSISKFSKITTLTVGYLRSSDWETDENSKLIEPQPSKYVKISLSEKDGKYHIISLQDTIPPETA